MKLGFCDTASRKKKQQKKGCVAKTTFREKKGRPPRERGVLWRLGSSSKGGWEKEENCLGVYPNSLKTGSPRERRPVRNIGGQREGRGGYV